MESFAHVIASRLLHPCSTEPTLLGAFIAEVAAIEPTEGEHYLVCMYGWMFVKCLCPVLTFSKASVICVLNCNTYSNAVQYVCSIARYANSKFDIVVIIIILIVLI